MLRFIDLFCGIGGFRVALERKGLECVFSCDIDEKVRGVYWKNFGDHPSGDITALRTDSIPQHDVLCAGFPCQPFSLSGKAGAFNDERGRLFFEIVRIAEYHKPSMLLLENVKNILTIDSGSVIQTIRTALKRIGYEVRHHVLNASRFGIPQRRERVYFVALRKDCPLRHGEPKETNHKIYLKDVLLNNVGSDLIVKRDDITITTNGDTPSLKPIQIGYLNKGGQGERIYSPMGHAITQAASSGGVGKRTGLYMVDGKVRRLHIKEAKRVMGFSIKHHVSDGLMGYSQLGNAIIPPMVRKVYESVRI